MFQTGSLHMTSMTSCWLCTKVVNDISRNFFSLQSYVYSPQHNKGRNHHTYIYVKVVLAGKTDIFTCKHTGIYFTDKSLGI